MSVFVSWQNGSDSSGDGSHGNPYRTVNHAAGQDRKIFLRGGVHTGVNDEIRNENGTENDPFEIRPAAGEFVVWDGSGRSWSSDTDQMFTVHSCQHVKVFGTHRPTSKSDAAADFIIRDANGGRGISSFKSDNVTFQDFVVHDTLGRAIGGSGDDMILRGIWVEDCVKENIGQALGSGGWASAMSVTDKWGLSTPASENKNILVEYCTIQKCWGELLGIWRTDGAIIRYNTLKNGFSVMWYANQIANALFYGNLIIVDTDAYNKSGVGRARGIQFSNEGVQSGETYTHDLTIFNNAVIDTSIGMRFWKSTGQSFDDYRNILAAYNVILGSQDRPLYFSDATNPSMTFRNNVVEGSNPSITNFGAWTHSNNNWVDGIPSGWSGNGNFSASPGFAGGAADDLESYKLLGSSLNIGAGVSVSGITTDAFGALRDGTAPDVGLHEFDGEEPGGGGEPSGGSGNNGQVGTGRFMIYGLGGFGR